MGKPTGFIEWERVDAPKRPVADRTRDFREFVSPLAPAEVGRQAGRCMDCGVPFCHQGCPLGNVIPDFNDHLSAGRWKEAFEVLGSTNNFPEFTGRLCPAPCESACVLAIDGDAVSIEHLEREIIERAFTEGWVQARPPSGRTGKRVAVVGSGPAGLAAAAQLNRAGHHVVVFERDRKPGGLLRYGIPDFKIEKSVIDRRLHLLADEGIDFQLGVDVGGSLRWDSLVQDFDAVVVAVGARTARRIDIPGAELSGVVEAMDFLAAENLALETQSESAIHAAGRRVLVLGGGDTGSDCVGTSLRQSALSVTQVELLPPPPKERSAANPWPQWPMTFRTSSSQEEGGQRIYGRRTVHLEGRDGHLVAAHWVQVELVQGQLRDIPGTEERVEVDLLIQAMGFVGPDTGALVDQLGVELDARGNILVDSRFATSVPKVYCAGDASRGASLVVWAISDGRESARAVDSFLQGRSSRLPTKGRSCGFGGRY
jgi:glutamate synthase (NADPH/NADH) small chain